MTEARYKRMLDTFLIPEIERLGIPLHRVWIQQDGATPHTARGVLTRHYALFPRKEQYDEPVAELAPVGYV